MYNLENFLSMGFKRQKKIIHVTIFFFNGVLHLPLPQIQPIINYNNKVY